MDTNSRAPHLSSGENRAHLRGWLLLTALALVSTAFSGHMLAQPSSQAEGGASNVRPDFDIRVEKERAPDGYWERHMARPDLTRVAFAAQLAAIARLQADFKNVELVTSPALDTIEIVRARPGTGFLTGPSDDRAGALKGFLQRYSGAFGITADDVTGLEVVADYENPAGNMAWVELEQRINGLPVFRGYLRGGFTAKGELAATTGQLAPGIQAAGLSLNAALTAPQAISRAAASVGWQVAPSALTQKTADPEAGRVVFAGPLTEDSRAWLLYFPLATGVARLAWATEIWGDPDVFFTILDAEDGTVLFRKNMTDFQTQSATYNIYNDDSPAPSSPTPALPGANYQAPYISRTAHTLIGNEAPNAFNNLGWMTDGTNSTQGNNTIAGIDRDGINGVDTPVTGASRVFDFAYNPQTDDPLTVAYQNGDVTNMFFWVNRFHDATYLLGFTEAARNFQNDNFGRGGAGADRVSAEGQDSSGTNNANFSTPADGGMGRMQMYLWTGPTPDRSGDLDRDIIAHELAHGLSNRLHANAAGLSTNMARGMGEGWSEFYARALFATADESVNGLYTVGGWSTNLITAGFTDNYYYGIRRFPYASIAVTGGASNRPFNPLTFADIDQTQLNLADGAYPRGPIGSATADQVHNIGEVWASMLFEVRSRFITRLGFATGNQRILQYVTDGMKLDPAGPTLLQARDAILSAATASGASAADIADIWAGFAARGLGVLASISNAGTGSGNTRVTENFNVPGQSLPSFTINDVSVTEGNSGTTTANFTVTLANPNASESRVNFGTADGTAMSGITQTSATPIAVPAATTTAGPANPYPATLAVSGISGTIQKLVVRLNSLTHTFPSDVDVLLVGPGGEKSILMSDVGSGDDVSGIDLTFEDGAPALGTGTLATGRYGPTDLTPGDAFPAPAPAGPYGTLLSVFNGTNPNGTWSLYVVDDAAADVGSIGSFSLVMTTAGTDYVPASGLLTFPAGTTTRTVSVTVNGDTAVEPNETFSVMLSSPTNAVIGDAQGIGTILNDDGISTPAAMISPAPGSHLATPSVMFTWSPGSGVSEIWLDVGTALNARDIYGASQGMGTTRTVNIRLTGGTIYVKLWSLQSGVWNATNYTYTSANYQSVLLLPASGATLPGATATFRWSPGTGVAEKWLYIGTSVGGATIYNATQGTLNERIVTGLPTDGSTLYVRLWSRISGVWLYLDYQVRAADTTIANMTSPANGSTLPGGTATFVWTNPGVNEIWLSVGTALGGTTLYNSTQGTDTSRTVTTLPTNGTPVYVRLWSRQGSVWRFVDYQYAGATTLSQLVLPATNGNLPGATALFRWTDGAGVIEKWLWIGTTAGGNNLYDASQGMLNERSVSGLPTNGSTIYVRLWSRITTGAWRFVDYAVRAADSTLATMTSPAAGASVAGGTGTFNWNVPGGVAEVWLQVGTTVGGTTIYNATQGTATSRAVSGLPTNGSPFYVRLWTRQGGVWRWIDYHYVTPATATLLLPAVNGTLPGSSALFRWTAGVGVAEKWLWIGTTAGGSNLYDATQASLTERLVNGLPTNGSTLYVRLWSYMSGIWRYNDYTVRAADSALAQMASPANGSTIAGGSATFAWSIPGGVSEVYLEVGTTVGGTNLFDDTQGTNTSRSLSGLPTSGPIYVRLWSKLGATWRWIDYHYTAAASLTEAGAAPTVTAPGR